MDSRLSLRASRISSAFHLRIGLPYRSDIRNARLIDKVIIRRLDAARIFYAAPTSISIDQSLLPGPLVPLRWARPFLLWLLFYSLVVNMRKFLPEKPQSHIIRIIVAAVDVIQRILSLIAKLDFAGAGKVIRGCMRSITNSAGLQASERFDLSDWNVCKLRGKEQLSDVYTRYRFDVPSVPNGVLEADVGQEVSISY